MPKLHPADELLLQATKWAISPGNNREALGTAALDFTTTPGLPTLPDLTRLAHAAANCVEAQPADLRATVAPLREVLALATAERRAWTESTAATQKAAEAKRFGNASPAVPQTRWDERADLK